jgi:LPXTG-motif cell wall-anchored protein
MAGPFTVRGPGGAIALSVQGGTAVDAAGKPVTTVANGASFYVTRDSAGEVSVGVKSDLKLSVGRIFLYNAKGDSAYGGEAEDAAKLVLAEGVPGALAATAKATFTVASTGQAPSPGAGTPPAGGSGGGELPVTGASTTLAAGVGVLLLVAGGAAVYLVRRRRVKFTA